MAFHTMNTGSSSAASIGAAGTDHGSQAEVIVRAVGLTKVFKDFWLRDRAHAIDNIDFEIRRGEIFGLLGPNGSGKSTTIKVILGLLKRTRGRVSVFGKPPTDVEVKRRIGYVPEESYLYPYLNARETLEYYGKLFHLSAKVREQRIDELLEMVGLTGVQFRQVHEYSKGMQRRIGIAQALINDPEFLILDEPTTGLDPIGTRQIKDLILHLGQRGKTILLSSHLLSDVEDCVDRMVILYGGKIRAEGTCDELLTSHTKSIIETDRLDDEMLGEVRRVLESRQIHVNRISQPRQKLEELFLNIVERAQQEQLATSGALHGGATASFLLTEEDAESTTGDALIESLTNTQADVESMSKENGGNAGEPGESLSGESDEETAALITDLVETEAPAELSSASPAEPSAVEQSTPADVDLGIIGALLDDEPRDKNEPHERGPRGAGGSGGAT